MLSCLHFSPGRTSTASCTPTTYRTRAASCNWWWSTCRGPRTPSASRPPCLRRRPEPRTTSSATTICLIWTSSWRTPWRATCTRRTRGWRSSKSPSLPTSSSSRLRWRRSRSRTFIPHFWIFRISNSIMDLFVNSRHRIKLTLTNWLFPSRNFRRCLTLVPRTTPRWPWFRRLCSRFITTFPETSRHPPHRKCTKTSSTMPWRCRPWPCCPTTSRCCCTLTSWRRCRTTRAIWSRSRNRWSRRPRRRSWLIYSCHSRPWTHPPRNRRSEGDERGEENDRRITRARTRDARKLTPRAHTWRLTFEPTPERSRTIVTGRDVGGSSPDLTNLPATIASTPATDPSSVTSVSAPSPVATTSRFTWSATSELSNVLLVPSTCSFGIWKTDFSLDFNLIATSPYYSLWWTIVWGQSLAMYVRCLRKTILSLTVELQRDCHACVSRPRGKSKETERGKSRQFSCNIRVVTKTPEDRLRISGAIYCQSCAIRCLVKTDFWCWKWHH